MLDEVLNHFRNIQTRLKMKIPAANDPTPNQTGSCGIFGQLTNTQRRRGP
jgi:hypothetical protein